MAGPRRSHHLVEAEPFRESQPTTELSKAPIRETSIQPIDVFTIRKQTQPHGTPSSMPMVGTQGASGNRITRRHIGLACVPVPGADISVLHGAPKEVRRQQGAVNAEDPRPGGAKGLRTDGANRICPVASSLQVDHEGSIGGLENRLSSLADRPSRFGADRRRPGLLAHACASMHPHRPQPRYRPVSSAGARRVGRPEPRSLSASGDQRYKAVHSAPLLIDYGTISLNSGRCPPICLGALTRLARVLTRRNWNDEKSLRCARTIPLDRPLRPGW
ncbi:hypothetical protein FBY34_7838 [Streptomyces sp. SLBN-115]|nr:hypothetical protein FBY34_7838 [Streptomyces sp. SLBN-115]